LAAYVIFGISFHQSQQMKRILFAVLIGVSWLLYYGTGSAQLVVTQNNIADQLAQALVGPGVTVTNATLSAASPATGMFTQTNTNLGIDEGIILTSGDITLAPGPNQAPSTGEDNGFPGDADLTQISTFQTFDATILEFDVTTIADTLAFNFVFASDEYNDFVGSSVNDAFGFFISGPGINGPFSDNADNMAIIPGTSVGITINDLNCGSYGQYYVCNDPWLPNGGGCTPDDCPSNANETTIEYDGFTVLMVAKHAVQACEVYHLKLAISDAGDGIYDSGVFLEAGSLTAYGTTIVGVTGYFDPNTGEAAVVEGCATGAFNFVLPSAAADTTVVHFEMSGSATNGSDYVQVPDSLIFYPGDSVKSIIINPIDDGTGEGAEVVTVYLYVPCSQQPYDSARIIILEELIAIAESDTTICIGQSAELTANIAPSWLWSPSTGVACTTCQTTTVTPLATTTYTLTITLGPCTATDIVTVTVDNPLPVFAGPDVEICNGSSVQLNAINAGSYTWFPPVGLSCTDCPDPVASPPSTTTYVVTGTSGCFTTSDTIVVVVNPNPVAVASPDVTVCPGDTVQLVSSGGVEYAWSPAGGLSDPAISDPEAVVFASTTYVVLVENEFGCTDTESVTINVFETPDVTVSNDTTIYLGNNVDLEATGGVVYQWVPPTYLSDPNSPFPTSQQPQDTITYYVTVTSADGCQTTDSVTINVRWDALVAIPSAFSPNNDGHNDLLRLLVRGIFDLDHFYVYNRWGELVFETMDVNLGWDGSYKGSEQPVGVYVYSYAGTDHVGNSISGSGSVTLVR
jgi:gliding motility-associated-like protein